MAYEIRWRYSGYKWREGLGGDITFETLRDARDALAREVLDTARPTEPLREAVLRAVAQGAGVGEVLTVPNQRGEPLEHRIVEVE
jgi:hypothetical protein